MFNTQLLLLAMMGTASAHMQMQFPAPFRSNFNQFAQKGTDAASNMNAPLKADGSDFPCKGFQSDLGTPAGQPTASFAVGGQSNITIADGGAPHGGGSCQISLSMDGAKTFTVVQSIIGGCPASGASYDFTVPEDAPTGDAVLAWTWHNNIGNREMYMNCAAVTLTGGGGAKRSPENKRAAAFSSRPGIYIANVGSAGDGCTTTGTDNKDIIYPDAGPDVKDTSTNSVAVPCGVTQGIGAVTGGSGSESGAGSGGSSSGGSGSGSGAASSSSSSITTSSAASPTPDQPGGVFATNSKTTLTTATATRASSSSKTSSTATSTGAGAGSATGTPAGGNTPGTQCSPEGAYVCLSGGTSFQRCASAEWSVVQQMAAGTTCSSASTQNLKMVALDGYQKRHLLRHRRSHV